MSSNYFPYERRFQPWRPFPQYPPQQQNGCGPTPYYGGFDPFNRGCNPCDLKQLEYQNAADKRTTTADIIKTGVLGLVGLIVGSKLIKGIFGGGSILGGSSSSGGSSSGGSSSAVASSASDPSADALKDQKKAADDKAEELKRKNEEAAKEAERKAKEYDAVKNK